MEITYLAELMACGKYTTVGAGMTAVFARGCSLAYIGAGESEVTLSRQVDSTECVAEVGVQTDALYGTWVDTSDSAKRILSWDDTGAAAEAAVSFNLWRTSGGAGR